MSSTCIKIYDAINCSNINICLEMVIKNIKKFNLCYVNHSTMNKLCEYFGICNLKIQTDILATILCINKLYNKNQNMSRIKINNTNIEKLYKNSIKTMKTLNIINKDNIFNPINKKKLKNILCIILTLLNIRINCKNNDSDTNSLIILYFSLGMIYLNNNNVCNNVNNLDIKNYNLSTISIQDLRTAWLSN